MKANISWITDQIATGGDLSLLEEDQEQQLDDLLGQDISLVIDCRSEEEGDDDALWNSFTWGPEYFHVPTDDREGHHIPQEHFNAAWDEAERFLSNGEKVFVHCHMGVNRGPSTAMYLLMKQGMLAEDAFDMIRAKRPIAGLAYAGDALEAYLKDEGYDATAIKTRLRELVRHIDKVFPIAEQEKVEHVMRLGHMKDARDLAIQISREKVG